jgi:hypothetical protein
MREFRPKAPDSALLHPGYADTPVDSPVPKTKKTWLAWEHHTL